MEQSTLESNSSLDRAIDLLFHVHASDAPQGVTAIGRSLGLPKSSVHRLASGLVDRTLLERDERGRLRPGAGLIALGLGSLGRDPVVAVARPVLEAEAAALGETTFLVGARAGRLIVLDKVEGAGFLRAAPTVGEPVPVRATAVGKLFRAFAEDALLGDGDGADADDASRSSGFTDRTLDAPAFEDAVARARRDGLAENHGEWIAGLSVVAAPVFGAGEALAAAFAVAGTTEGIRRLGTDCRTRARAAGEAIGARLRGEAIRRAAR